MKKNLAFLLAMVFALTAVLGVAPMASAEEEAVAPSTEIAYFNVSLRVGATLLFAVSSDGYTVNPDGTVDNLKLLAVKDSATSGTAAVSDGELLASGDVTIDANGLTKVQSFHIGEDEKEHLFIEWSDGKENVGKNHYTTNIHGISFEKYLEFIEKTEIGKFEGFGE